MRDTNPDPAANAPNPDAEAYADASNKRQALFDQNTFSVTPEQKAQLEAKGTSVGAIFDKAQASRLADEALRKATIEAAPHSVRVEQALSGWFSEQGIWGNDQQKFVQRYTEPAYERYLDRLEKQKAQGITANDQMSFEQSIAQDIDEGLIDPTLHHGMTTSENGIWRDP
jgi:hypothetical protein